MSKCFYITAYGYQSMLARYLVLDEYAEKGLEYQCQTQTAPPPASKDLTLKQKLFLDTSYRAQAKLVYAKNLAVLIEGKKQFLHQGIKVKKK
jgi:hypothetical protein